MIISGKNSIYEALVGGKTINKLYINKQLFDSTSKDIVSMAKEKGIRVEFVDKKILEKYSQHNQGYVAEITDYVYYEIEDIVEQSNSKGKSPFIVLLDSAFHSE